jgi:hypothetical protein
MAFCQEALTMVDQTLDKVKEPEVVKTHLRILTNGHDRQVNIAEVVDDEKRREPRMTRQK